MKASFKHYIQHYPLDLWNCGWLGWAGRYCSLQNVPGVFNWIDFWGSQFSSHLLSAAIRLRQFV